MLLYLTNYLAQFESGFNVFNYLTMRAILGALTALILSFIIGPRMIKKLSVNQLGQPVRRRAGTPLDHRVVAEVLFVVELLPELPLEEARDPVFAAPGVLEIEPGRYFGKAEAVLAIGRSDCCRRSALPICQTRWHVGHGHRTVDSLLQGFDDSDRHVPDRHNVFLYCRFQQRRKFDRRP